MFDAALRAQLAQAFGIAVPVLERWHRQAGGRLLAGPEALIKWHWMLTSDRAPLFETVLRTVSGSGVAPRALPDSEGAVVTAIDGRYFSLFRRESPYGDAADEPDEAGRTVGRMHRALADVAGQANCPRAVPVGEAEVLLHEQGLEHLARALPECASIASKLPVQLVHRDLHQGNFLCVEAGVMVVDFDSFASGSRIVDALFGAFRLADGAPGRMGEFMAGWTEQAAIAASESSAGLQGLAADFMLKVAFVLRESASGNVAFAKDLEKYVDFSERALELCRAYPAGVAQLMEQSA